MVNWSMLVNADADAVEQFANRQMSGRELYGTFRKTEAGGTARSLLRNHGVTYARRLARKALRRRMTMV
jgi:hypothetical protein